MVRDVDVIHAGEHGTTRKMNAPGRLGRLSRGARELNHQVAEQLTERMLGVARDRRCQEIVPDPIDEGDVAPCIGEDLVGIAPKPFFVDGVAVAEVFDAGASGVEQRGRNLCAGRIDLSKDVR